MSNETPSTGPAETLYESKRLRSPEQERDAQALTNKSTCHSDTFMSSAHNHVDISWNLTGIQFIYVSFWVYVGGCTVGPGGVLKWRHLVQLRSHPIITSKTWRNTTLTVSCEMKAAQNGRSFTYVSKVRAGVNARTEKCECRTQRGWRQI